MRQVVRSRSMFAMSLGVLASASLSLFVAGCGPDLTDPSVVEAEPAAVTATPAAPGYLVSFAGGTIPSNATEVLKAADPSFKLLTSYANVGVLLVSSSSSGFAARLRADSRVDSVGSARSVASALVPKTFKKPAAHPCKPNQGGSDPLSYRQWDMNQIKAPQARAISGGKSSVLVGVLDSGVDLTHPDLAGQVVTTASASCIGGVANTNPAIWANDIFGHGTHVSGIIAAKKNNVGIVGVAPGVKLAAVKVANDDANDMDTFGLVFADAMVCAIDWAIGHNFDLMNASLTIDPFTAPIDDVFCSDQPDRAAIVKMVRRAVLAAAAKKITLVSSTGNFFTDLASLRSNPKTGPDCRVIPVQLPRVIGVSSVGVTQLLWGFSNYGFGAADLTGPGGDASLPYPAVTDTTASGQVLSSVPPNSLYYQASADWNGQVQDCSSGTCSTYAYLQGTSQAAPHVTGTAALIISKYGKLAPEALLAKMSLTAQDLPCPPSPYDPLGTGQPATCKGTTNYNNFYGAGEINALAVSQ